MSDPAVLYVCMSGVEIRVGGGVGRMSEYITVSILTCSSSRSSSSAQLHWLSKAQRQQRQHTGGYQQIPIHCMHPSKTYGNFNAKIFAHKVAGPSVHGAESRQVLAL